MSEEPTTGLKASRGDLKVYLDTIDACTFQGTQVEAAAQARRKVRAAIASLDALARLGAQPGAQAPQETS